MKRSFVLGTLAIFFLISSGVYIWQTRWRPPEFVDLKVAKKGDILLSTTQCKAELQARVSGRMRYEREVLVTLTSGQAGHEPSIRLQRTESVPRDDLLGYLEMIFKTRAERTVFVAKEPGIVQNDVDQLVALLRSSQFVDRVCVVDSSSLPDGFGGPIPKLDRKGT